MSLPSARALGAWIAIACGAGGCLAKKTPDHLKVAPPAPLGPPVTPPTTLSDAVGQLTKGDPLVRRPNARSEEWWLSAGGGAAIAAWREVVGSGPADAAALASFEGAWRGTPAVALARGARLAELEHQLLTEAQGLEGDRALVTWLGTVVVTGPAGPSDVRPALDWIDPDAGRAGLLRVAERHVVLGWLDGPEVPLAPVENAMVVGTFDRLRAMPAGQLVVARALSDGSQSEQSLQLGLDLLADATHLALIRSAADSAPQQEAARDVADSLKAAHSLQLDDAQDPLPVLVAEAFESFVQAGGTDASTGLGLVALTAARLLDACPDTPCTGLDRHDSLQRAGVWSSSAATYAWAWRLSTAQDLRDQLEVAEELGLSTDALPDVADLIVGERTARIPAALLQQPTLTPSTALAITRGLGQPDGTRAEDALSALDAHIARLCSSPPPTIDPRWKPPVERICGRPSR